MIHTFSIQENNIILFPMSKLDSEKYRILRNRSKEWFGDKNEISLEEQVRWFNNYLIDESVLMFSIYDLDKNFVGGNSIYNINYDTGECEYGRVVINESYRGKGYGRNATQAAIIIAKQYLKLRKIRLEVISTNITAKNIYIQSGFAIRNEQGNNEEMVVMIKEL